MESTTYGHAASPILAAVIDSGRVRRWILELRKQYTQHEVAQQLGISQSYVAKIEGNPKVDFSLNKIVQIAKRLGFPDLSGFERHLEHQSYTGAAIPTIIQQSPPRRDPGVQGRLAHAGENSALPAPIDRDLAARLVEIYIAAANVIGRAGPASLFDELVYGIAVAVDPTPEGEAAARDAIRDARRRRAERGTG